MILLADPEIAAVAVRECGEPLVEVPFRVDPVLAAANPWRSWLRAGVAERLRAAAAALPAGVELLVVEGYRPLPLQERHFAEHRAELAAREPGWDAARLRREASAYIAPPDVAPHCTGGAVDLTLCTAGGAPLDLGTAVNASPLASGGRCATAAPGIGAAARANRELLGAALGGAGLVNYPTEWWHWSYGERYWAHTGGVPAVYGPVPPPT